MEKIDNFRMKLSGGASVVPPADAPLATSTPVTSVGAGDPFNYTFTASDSDLGDTLTITAPILPSWLTITDNGNGTADLTGTPTTGDAGDHEVVIKVNDTKFDVYQNFTITVAGASNNYTENQGLISLIHDTGIYDGADYSGGYITFDITNSTVNDQITIVDDGVPSVVNNELTVVGTSVYIGNGTVATLVGSVDGSENGQNGQPLKINFSNAFKNADYSVGNNGDTLILGWTTVLSQIRLGIDNIAGQASPVDPTYPVNSEDDTDIPSNLGSLVVALSDEILVGSEGFSARLTSSGITTANGFDVVRGPAIYSDSTITVEAGDTLSFDWRALGGGDAYDVFGYIIDIDNGTTQLLLDETGVSANATTAWATVTATIAQTGKYRFVFIAGTYDFTGGRAAGAQLFLDSYRVSQVNPPKPITATSVLTLATKIRFENASDDIDNTTRNVSITAIDSSSGTDTTDTTINITAVNDAPVTTVNLNTTFLESATSIMVDADTSDAENDTINYSLTGVDASLFTVNSDGDISFASAPNFDSPLDNGGDNVYNIILTASDGVLSDVETLTITIDQDSDADGVSNSQEITDGTDPNARYNYKDSDSDGVPDNLDDNGTIDDDSGNGIINYFIDYPIGFQCSGDYFISQKNTLFQLDTTVTPYGFDDISPGGYTGKEKINGIGFNYKDGYVYGMKGGSNHLIRIESSGHMRDMGAITDLPSKGYYRGDFDLEGNYYVVDGKKLYTVNISTLVATKTTLSAGFGSPDIAFNVRDGKMYGAQKTRLYTLDLDTAKVTSKTVTNLPSATYGSAWFDSAGRLFFSSNQTGDIYRVDDLATPVANYVSKGQPTSSNDGTACAGTPLLEHTISPAATTPSTIVTHTYTIDNGLLSGDALGDPLSIGFDDVLSDGRTFVDASLVIVGALNNSPTTNSYGGTSTIDINGLQLDPSSTVTITIDVAIPTGLGGTYYNQAKLTGVASYIGGPEILSDNPGGARPDATPLIVQGSNNDNVFSGSVYNDLNKNGSRDNGEPSVPGVLVNLDNGGGSTTSDINGNYTFEALADNTYTATMSLPAGYTNIGPNPIANISVSSGSTVSDNNFAIYSKASITGFVFNDVDGDKRIGSSELGISGVSIELFNKSGVSQGTTTTDTDGEYSFDNLNGGLYWVEETDDGAYTSVSVNKVAVNVGSGQQVEQHFSDILAGTISGAVFNDINGNGIQDVIEEPLAGVTVEWDDGSTTDNMITDANGLYSFTVTPNQSYIITETDPAGYSSITSNTKTVSVATGGAAIANFADIEEWTISGMVFDDINGNNVLDEFELGLEGVTVQLSSGQSMTTSATGIYQFTGVSAGSFTVISTVPTGYASLTSTSHTVVIPVGGADTANFPLVQTGSVLGTVFNDLNGNGTQDAGENGTSGLLIELNGQYVHSTSDGSYEFTNVAAGSYTVNSTTPADFASTTGISSDITLTGSNGASANFGIRPDGVLSGVAFNDLNGDGTQDEGESGMANVVISLDGGSNITTVADGSFVYNFLAAGSKTLAAINPTGYSNTSLLSLELTPTDAIVFGFQMTGTISGQVINDLNGNSAIDTGESGFSGVNVTLTDSGAGSVVVSTTADGGFLFTGVTADTYTLSSVDAPGYVSINSNTDTIVFGAGDVYGYTFFDKSSVAPVANGRILSTDENTPLRITLSGSDSDGSVVSYQLMTSPSHGRLSGTAPNLTYTPTTGFDGSDQFQFRVVDNDAVVSESVNIVIRVNNVNVLPVANAQSLLTNENTPLSLTLSGSDSDGTVESYQVGSPSHGILSGTAPNLTYTPTTKFDGSDSFTFTVTDNDAGVSILATISITVSNVNILPVVSDDNVNIEKGSENNVINILANDSDEDNLTVISAAANNGTVVINADGSLTYTPNDDFSGVDTISYTISDGKGGETSAVVTVTIELPGNLPPITVDDEFDFSTFDSVTLDILSNDSDPEGDVIELTSASSNKGLLSIVDDKLIFTPESEVSGIYTITYSIKDSAGNIATATVIITITSDLAPAITLANDLCGALTVNANGLYTRVDLGETSAVDRFGNPLPVSLVNGEPLYPPGLNEVFWQATDSEGNTSIAKQLVCVMPLISIEKDKTVSEGESSTIGVYLNGESPVYPVTIPFNVIGGEDDITLVSGEVVIESGTQIHVPFDVFADDLLEDDETVEVSIAPTVNRGDKYRHTLTITEVNVVPEISLVVMQANEQRLTVSQVDGNVIITSSIYDPNTQDSHSYQWSSTHELIDNLSVNERQFVFDPSELSEGVYTFSLFVNDNAIPQGEDIANVYINIVPTLVALGREDSDGDLIPDYLEGYADKDGDGIPDYLDRIDECNVLQEKAAVFDGYLIEGQSGVCLRRGDFTFSGQTGGAQIIEEEFDEVANDELPSDPEALNIGGIFDYIAYNLPDLGQSFAIVLPQRRPIPANAIYRKYRRGSGWGFFIEDVNNSLWSTQGEPGYCPPPNTSGDNSVWTLGLTEGHWCVQQIIEDGGMNDDDGEVNGAIVDPGGVGVMLTSNHLPVAIDDTVVMDVNAEQSIDVLINDTDEDGDVLTITSATVSIGSVSIVDGQLYYVSANNYGGDITINYGISDNNGGTDHATVIIRMVANEAPVVDGERSEMSQGGSISLNLLENDTDPEEDTLSLVAVDNTHVSFSDDGQATFTPAENFYGEVVILYTVQDSAGNTTEGQWVIVVTENATTTKGGGALFWPLLLLIGCLITRRRSQG